MKLIVCVDNKWGIGKDNSLLFRLPADMKFFKEKTTGGAVVMGSNTLKSFPNGAPLKNRVNIVLSANMEEREDCTVVRSLASLSEELKKYPSDGVYVIGGAKVYKELLPYCEEALVTKASADGGATAFFENLDENPDFVLSSQSDAVETNGFTVRFTTYKNRNVKKL